MKAKTIISIVFAIVVVVIAVVVGVMFLGNKEAQAPAIGTNTSSTTLADYKSATYNIDGADVVLVNGYASTEIVPGSASRLVTQFFGNDVAGDLNGDGMTDEVFLLTQSGGGSGTFYYVAVALKTASGYKGTNAILLGDRIAPQSTEIKDGEIVVNYADRKAGEPMSTQPSVGVSKYFRVENGVLVAVGK